MKKFFVLLLPLMSGCLQTSELEISSESDYSQKGLSISAADVRSGGVGAIQVSLNYVTPREVIFKLKSEDHGATAGFDYQAIDRQFSIPPGQSKVIIPLVTFRRPGAETNRALKLAVTEIRGAEALVAGAQLTIRRGPSRRLKNVQLLAVVQGSTCVTLSDGDTYCWGNGFDGQLGSGTSATYETSRKAPVPGLRSDAVGLAGGTGRYCAWYADGEIYCWGRRTNGGGGTIELPTTKFAGPAPAVVQAAGNTSSMCLRFIDGSVKCDGVNTAGRLGVGHTSAVLAPEPVLNLGAPAVDIADGLSHTCAVLNTGEVKCWGNDAYGQLGDGTIDVVTISTAQGTLIAAGATNVAAGSNHTCALMADQSVYCWGQNTSGYLGVGNGSADTATPLPVSLPGPAAKIAAEAGATCALLTNGDLYCWGDNSFGRLGGTVAGYSTPVKVQNLPGAVRDFAMSATHTCAVLQTDNELMCWGSNSANETDNFAKEMTYPTDLEQYVGQEVAGVSLTLNPTVPNRDSACVLLIDGQVSCHGSNFYGDLGRGISYLVLLYDLARNWVLGLDLAGSAKSIAGSLNHTCVLTNGGAPLCWGKNPGVTTSVDPAITPLGLTSSVKQLSAGTEHMCALDNDGTVKCWGKISEGTGACPLIANPTSVAGITDAVSLHGGYDRSCVITASGQVKCWGNNRTATFGNGSISNFCDMTPETALLNEPAVKLALGWDHTCAVTISGAVKCWGMNSTGQTGQAGTGPYLAPRSLNSLSSGVKDIAAGIGYTCVTMNEGSVRCWGTNSFGQLGLYETLLRESTHIPTALPDLAAGVKSLSASLYTTCAIVEGNFLKCWGLNSTYINNVTASSQPDPVSVWDSE
jgi:alpha-tubulin suppressor-like RCC1 family protein